MARRTLLMILLVACCWLGGCGAFQHMIYTLFGGEKKIPVPAEFADLENQTVAVVIFADEQVQYEHSMAPLELSLVMAKELRDNVEGVKVVDPYGVVRYQAQNINWDAMEKTRLGKLLGARYVLYVSLIEFTTREPGSLNLYRGRITAEASVWDTSLPECDARKWYAGDLRVVYPENTHVGELEQSDVKIRYWTEKLFAEKLVRRFYDHKVTRTP